MRTPLTSPVTGSPVTGSPDTNRAPAALFEATGALCPPANSAGRWTLLLLLLLAPLDFVHADIEYLGEDRVVFATDPADLDLRQGVVGQGGEIVSGNRHCFGGNVTRYADFELERPERISAINSDQIRGSYTEASAMQRGKSKLLWREAYKENGKSLSIFA